MCKMIKKFILLGHHHALWIDCIKTNLLKLIFQIWTFLVGWMLSVDSCSFLFKPLLLQRLVVPSSLNWLISLIWGYSSMLQVARKAKFPRTLVGSKIRMSDVNCLNSSKFVQTCPNLSKFIKTCRNMSKLAQTCPNRCAWVFMGISRCKQMCTGVCKCACVCAGMQGCG